MPIRQPIISFLGHIDHGKTTLLDKIRGTAVQISEVGGITQAIGATNIPIKTVKEICGSLLDKFKFKITIPGFLIIDTPGHSVFITLRKRGGSVADLAILVIDINEGFQPQTDESLNFLKQFKTPFLVAATKIDLIPGWYPHQNECFMDSYKKQSSDVREELEKKVYNIIAYLIIGGKEPIVTKIKALLQPPVLKELRVEKKFESVKEVHAAAGIKISAPNLENVIAGSPIICVSDKSEIERAKQEVQKEVEEVEFSRDVEGVIAKADTLGSLEALIKMLKDKNIPIRKAEVGKISKQDIVELDTIKDELKRVVLGFNVNVLPEAEKMARDLKIKIFLNNIIYRLIEDYQKWYDETTKMKKEEKLEKMVWPAKISILRGFTFRRNKPAIVGAEILSGRIKQKVLLMRKDGKVIGEISQIQSEGKNVEVAKKGEKVAISLPEVTVGRQIKEGDVLYVHVPRGHIKEFLTKFRNELSQEEIELIREIEKIKSV